MQDAGDMDTTTDNPLLNVRGRIAEILLNAPERKNALSRAAWERIPALIDQINALPDVRICVVKGAGSTCFCAGADIAEFEATRSTPEAATHYDATNVAAFKALKSFPGPVIAAIEGPCLGGGLGLALACDLRIASKTAFFGIPAAKLGLAYPPDALTDLLEAVSPSDAKRILFTGDRFSADAALQMGLINEIVEPDGLKARIEALCSTISTNAPLSIRAAKQAVNHLSQSSAAGDLKRHRADAERCIESADYKEGYRAFLEKRRPEFSGY